MALDKPQLAAAILQAFQKAQQAPPNTKTPAQLAQELASDLADAIEDYVKAGEVKGVSVAVKDVAQNPIGTGTQTGVVKLQ